MSALVRMELLKLVKRPMTWILLILLLGGIGFITVIGVLQLQSAGAEVRDALLRNTTMPGIIPQTAEFIYIFGSIMLAILAASAIGSEYSWGTLRPMLATGMPRGRFMAAKLIALALAAAAFVLLPLLMNALLALPIAALNDRPFVADTVDAAWFGHLAAIVGRTYLLVLMPMAIAFFIALIGRSQAAGIGAALGLMIGEQIVSVLLLSLDAGWARTVVNLLPGRNSQVLLNHNTFDVAQFPPGLPGEWRALLTLIVYGAICLLIAFLIFRRRDVRGAA